MLFKELQGESRSYRIESLTVFNWGPFQGLHVTELHDEGTAIIGRTGSGKTTLVDALMTMLVAKPRYNLASTGGHESDRDIMSYIRGLTGQGNASGDQSHVLRKGKTVTGLSLQLKSAEEKVSLVAILWLDGTGFASSDRKDLWFFSKNASFTLEKVLQIFEDEGVRDLKKWSREQDEVFLFETKKSYLSKVRQYFEVGEKAFELLNRAAGLKQLNSIDHIFRELVLEDNSKFQAAGKVSQEFDDLVEIKNQLDIAKRQIESLVPIRSQTDKMQREQSQIDMVRHDLAALPHWFCRKKIVNFESEALAAAKSRKSKSAELEALHIDIQKGKDEAQAARDSYMQLGGDSLEALKDTIATKNMLLASRRKDYSDYSALMATLKLKPALQKADFVESKQAAKKLHSVLTLEKNKLESSRYEANFRKTKADKELIALRDEIAAIKANPSSNVPISYQKFRSELAEALLVDEASLPFIAELIQVRPEEKQWRGAIERAIGGHRLRVMVEARLVKPAIEWINQRNNRLHVKVVSAESSDIDKSFKTDGYCNKLEFKDHGLQGAATAFLAGLDLHCVESSQALINRAHCLTKEGTVSRQTGRFEKQDKYRLDQGWLLGFSNKDQLEALMARAEAITVELSTATREFEKISKEFDHCAGKLQALSILDKIEFEQIDYLSVEQHCDQLAERLKALIAPDSDLSKAKAKFESLTLQIGQLESAKSQLDQQLGMLTRQETEIAKQLADLTQQLGEMEHASYDEAELIRRYKLNSQWLLGELTSEERQVLGKIRENIKKREIKITELSQSLVRAMSLAKKEDTGALADTGSELDDVPSYLGRLRELEQEDLPEKVERFQAYLNKSSDQGVTQLLQEANEEVSSIEEKIFELNNTLRKVDFEKGRFFQLVPQRVVHADLKNLNQAVKNLRSAKYLEDGGVGHFKALSAVISILKQAIESKNLQSSRALLDPRHRLQFCIDIVCRDSGHVLEKRTGSQSGSGGEKETIASYILTASLCYALSPKGETKPLFSTIVLDEAFSKSSQAVAGRIVAAIREFGLHPLFITPNKELKLLERHTKSAVLVHRKDNRSYLNCLSWEQVSRMSDYARNLPHENAKRNLQEADRAVESSSESEGATLSPR